MRSTSDFVTLATSFRNGTFDMAPTLPRTDSVILAPLSRLSLVLWDFCGSVPSTGVGAARDAAGAGIAAKVADTEAAGTVAKGLAGVAGAGSGTGMVIFKLSAL